jgi:GGDEF domain-containing protein
VTLRAEERLQSPKAEEGGALFMLDMDNVKIINDSQGHTVGDHAGDAGTPEYRAVLPRTFW